MQLSFYNLFVLLAVPAVVNACEGQCIVSITNAFLGNYTLPIHAVFQKLENEIDSMLHSGTERSGSRMTYLAPILAAYGREAYGSLENAIFPSYFHGKCLKDGIEPAGCPNPDCPIVCGTPGSLVHFYSKLRYIAYSQTSAMLTGLMHPTSKVYQEVEKHVVAQSTHSKPTSRMVRIYSRSFPRSISDNEASASILAKRANDVKSELRKIVGGFSSELKRTCGGSGYSMCSWEAEMKEFILSFP